MSTLKEDTGYEAGEGDRGSTEGHTKGDGAVETDSWGGVRIAKKTYSFGKDRGRARQLKLAGK